MKTRADQLGAAASVVGESKKVPRAACRFDVGPVQFAKVEGEQAANEQPITMLARSAEPIVHWYWGKIAHDFAGMKLRKERLPLDWCHWWETNVGYADNFDKNEQTGLTVGGTLVSVRDDDQAADIIARGRRGVPYEASIDTDPLRIEEVAADVTVQCNGRDFVGPGYVVREWLLNAVAVCPFGADPNTRTQFAAGGKSNGDEEIELTIFSAQGDDMSTAAPATKPGEKLADSNNGSPPTVPPVATAAAGDAGDPAAAFKAKLDRFVAEFGAENGSKWAADGKSYEDALKLHAEGLAAKLKADGAAKDAEIEALKAKLAAIPTGESEPASFADGEGAGKGEPKKASKLGASLSKFASSMKMPAGFAK